MDIGATIAGMTRNILDQLGHDQLVRISFENITSATGLDAGSSNGSSLVNVNELIGRMAHICYLENQLVATQLVLSLYDYLV